jgi:hypothetical protein
MSSVSSATRFCQRFSSASSGSPATTCSASTSSSVELFLYDVCRRTGVGGQLEPNLFQRCADPVKLAARYAGEPRMVWRSAVSRSPV